MSLRRPPPCRRRNASRLRAGDRSCDVETFDETTSATIGAGDILLAEDLVGAGHAWRFVPARDGQLKPWRRCYIHLGDEYDHFVELLRPG